MATVSVRKRKRQDDKVPRPEKKVAIATEPATATVKGLLRPRTNPPIIATSTGLRIPPELSFEARKSTQNPRGQNDRQASQDLSLQSTAHRTLDYTVREDGAIGASPPLRHYLATYDPATGSLNVVEARKMLVRGVVRAKQISRDPAEEREQLVRVWEHLVWGRLIANAAAAQTMFDRKADLSQAFGTRKAKKALQDGALNALSPQKQSAFAEGPVDDAAQAIMDVIGEKTATMATKDQLQAVVTEAKPVPKANLDAKDIQDVYDPSDIIGADVLHFIPIRDWQESVRTKQNMQIASRFVAKRLNSVAAGPGAVLRLRVLRYLLFLILFFLHTKPGKQRGTRRIASRDAMRTLLAPAPDAVLDNIRRKFSEGSDMRKFHCDFLLTHCCVLASIVDGFEVDTGDLKDDLRLDQAAINTYFKEIGAKIIQSTNKRAGEAGKRSIAKLSLPLVFPKQKLHRMQR